MIVVAGQEHEAFALQLCAQKLEQSLGRPEGIADRPEHQVEHITKEDYLVDVECWFEQGERRWIAKDVVSGPSTEMHVGNDERAHYEIVPDLTVAWCADPRDTLRSRCCAATGSAGAWWVGSR